MTSRRTVYAFGLFLSILPILLCCAFFYVYIGMRVDAARKERQTAPISKVFDNLACMPPCWNNIYLGKSTREDIFMLRERLGKGPFESSPIYQGSVYIFQFKNPETNSLVVFYLDDAGVVESIQFMSVWFSRIPLWYALQAFGEPEYAIVDEYGPIVDEYGYPVGPTLILYYPNSGIEVACLPQEVTLSVILPITIDRIGCESDSNTNVTFYPAEAYQRRLVLKFGSPERAEYAQQFFCPWVGVDASYLFVDWGPLNDPEEYPAVSPAEIKSQCPTGE